MKRSILLFVLLICTAQLYAQQNTVGNFGSLFFDGVDDYVEIPDHQDYEELDELTVELWIKRTNRQSRVALVDYIDSCNTRGTWAFRLYKDNLRWIVGKNGLSRGYKKIQDKNAPLTWEHWAFQFDDKQDRLTVWLNGTIVHEEYTDANINSAKSVLRLGNDIPGAGSFAFAGWMDDVRIWNRLLSKRELQKNAKSFNLLNPTGLIGAWDFENIKDGKAIDSSPNKNHGIIHGASASQHVPYDKLRARAVVSVEQKAGDVFSAELFPNPAQSHTQLRIFQPTPNQHIRLIDLNGKVVLEQQTFGQAMLNVDLGEFPNGLYILELKSDERIETMELLIRH